LFWTTWTTNKIRHDRRQSPTRSELAAERHACAWRSATEGNGGSRFARRPGARPREISLHRSDDAHLDGCRQLSSRCRHRRSHAFLRLRGNRRVPSSGLPKGRPRYGLHRLAGLCCCRIGEPSFPKSPENPLRLGHGVSRAAGYQRTYGFLRHGNGRAQDGRVVVCGLISGYNKQDPGMMSLGTVILKRLRVEGFLLLDYVSRFMEAATQLGQWKMFGKIKDRETIVEGLEKTPDAINMLFTGANTGKLIVKI